MAGDGTLATTAIITKGLTCGHGPLDECKSGLITSYFGLYCTMPTPPWNAGGGGAYDRPAWNKFEPGEIQNFYKEVDPEFYHVPIEDEADFLRKYKPIKITFKMGNFETEHYFSVPEERLKIIVNAFDLLEATRDKIRFAISGLKNIISDVTVRVTNFRKRNK